MRNRLHMSGGVALLRALLKLPNTAWDAQNKKQKTAQHHTSSTTTSCTALECLKKHPEGASEILKHTLGGREVTHQVTLDGGVDDLRQDVLVGEAHHKPVLGRVVLVLVLQNRTRRVQAEGGAGDGSRLSERAHAVVTTTKNRKKR